jgi:chromosomal replication initiator protein
MIGDKTYSKEPPIRSGAYMAVVGQRGSKYRFPKYREDKVDFIFDTVCDWFGKTRKELQSKQRYRSVLEPRQICMMLLRQNTYLTHKQIALMFGGRDHTTCIHSVRTIKNLMETDERLRQTIQALEVKIQ